MSLRHDQFPDDLIQAVSDWQRGGDFDQKRTRGAALKTACRFLDPQFRSCAPACFRRVALFPNRVWELHSTLQLEETISSWTLDSGVARNFKGGVPREGIPGAILKIVPPASSVVVNLNSLYNDTAFSRAHAEAQSRIEGYAFGIGKYGNSQCEIVLELTEVPISAIYALGGHSGSLDQIAQLYFGHAPTMEDREEFDALLQVSEQKLGPRWLVGAAKDRVLQRTLEHYEIIKRRTPSATSDET